MAYSPSTSSFLIGGSLNLFFRLHKKATMEKKKEVKYVVAKKNQAAKRAVRPSGVKGHFKQVDKRMKKDDKKRKATERRKGGRKGKK